MDSSLEAEQGPDLFRVTYTDFGCYAASNVLIDLSEYLPPDFPDAFTEGLRAAVEFEGVPYGVPHHTDVSAIVYNKDLFRSAGIGALPDRLEDAWSRDEFLDIARRLRDAQTGNCTAFGMNWQLAGAFRWLNWLYAAGGSLYNSAATKTTVESPEALSEMLEWISLSPRGMHDLLENPVYAIHSHVAFSDLPHTDLDPGDRAKVLGVVVDCLRDAGLDVFYVDYSSPNGEVSAVKAIVPGLEVETMSYGRIGPRNLRRLLDRDSDLIVSGDASGRPAARRILLAPEREAELGPAWFDFEALERTVGNLYPLYREPRRHVAALAAER